MVLFAHRILAQRGGISVIGHVDGNSAEALLETIADIRPDPIGREIRLRPDDAVARGGGHVHTDAANLFP